MTREEFEALLEEAYNAGYEQAELDCVNESNRETRARNRETTKREVKKRFEPIRFLDKDSDEKNQKAPTHLSSKDIYNHQVHIKQTKGGRVQNVVSGDYGLSSVRSKNGKYAMFDDNRVKENPKLDRTNYFKKLNDEIKNEKDPEVRKKKVTSAKKFLNELKEKRKKKIGYKAPVFYRTDDD